MNEKLALVTEGRTVQRLVVISTENVMWVRDACWPEDFVQCVPTFLGHRPVLSHEVVELLPWRFA